MWLDGVYALNVFKNKTIKISNSNLNNLIVTFLKEKEFCFSRNWNDRIPCVFQVKVPKKINVRLLTVVKYIRIFQSINLISKTCFISNIKILNLHDRKKHNFHLLFWNDTINTTSDISLIRKLRRNFPIENY